MRHHVAQSGRKENLTTDCTDYTDDKIRSIKRSNDRQYPATGESDLNYTPYLFKVAMTSPDRIPDAFKADADAAVKRFDGFVADWEKNPKSGKAGKKASPEERKGLYELYLNKLSQ